MTNWLPTDEPLWYWSPPRVFAALIAFAYALATYLFGDPVDVIRVLCFLVLPMACIWFPEPIGDFVGSAGQGFIDRPTPEVLVSIAGWVLLLMPLLVLALMWVITR